MGWLEIVKVLLPIAIESGKDIVEIIGKIRAQLDADPSNDPTWLEIDAMVKAAQAGALRDTSRDV